MKKKRGELFGKNKKELKQTVEIGKISYMGGKMGIFSSFFIRIQR